MPRDKRGTAHVKRVAASRAGEPGSSTDPMWRPTGSDNEEEDGTDDAEMEETEQRAPEEMPRWATDAGTRNRHICLFLPKFHCELNWVEQYWACAKHYARANCLYTLAGLRETIPIALIQDLKDLTVAMQNRPDLPVVPVLLQRRHARISWQYAAEYLLGADACDAMKHVKSKRHHDTGDARMRKREARMAARVDFLLGN